MPTASVFVDTNVFVYARLAREAEKQLVAAQWIDRLWREQSGGTSMQVLSECYVTLTRGLEPAPSSSVVWDYVRSLLAWHPQPVDAQVFDRAFEIEQRHRLNWWDCLIVASAQLQGCSAADRGSAGRSGSRRRDCPQSVPPERLRRTRRLCARRARAASTSAPRPSKARRQNTQKTCAAAGMIRPQPQPALRAVCIHRVLGVDVRVMPTAA
jgi:predicted nucleic acid-binding protein